MRLLFILFSFFGFFIDTLGQTVGNKTVYTDSEGWTIFHTGNIPLVISVPHGGVNNLSEVSDRSCDGAITVTDSYTRELALEISDYLMKYYNVRPYIIFCEITRKDVDQNREIAEGTCGNTLMEKPWRAFHNFIDSALTLTEKEFGGALYIDLHGHGHPIQRLELGYLLKESDLSQIYSSSEETEEFEKGSSFINFKTVGKNKKTLKDHLFGPSAFGTLMANEGFPSVPSQQDPLPSPGEKYFNGGYNTRRFTTKDHPNVFGWQIESNMKGVRDAAGRPVFAAAFSRVILKYLKEETNFKLPESIDATIKQ